MNSAEYELEVANVVERGIQDGDHGLDPRCARVIRKPKYYSRDREQHIEFDASVEVTRPKESDPFLYWVIECKHYNHNVPVDDAEEFFAKLQQIGGANSKGTIVSKTGFASGTIAFCRSKGIGLWRYDPDGEPAMVVQADTARDRAIIDGMIECHFTPHFFGLATNGYLSNELEDLVGCEFWTIGQSIESG